MSTSHLYRHTNTMLTSWTAPPIPLPLACLFLLLTASYVFSIVKWRARTRGHPLPPGPRRYPIIGSYRFNKGRDIWQVNQDLYDTYGKHSAHKYNSLFPSHPRPRILSTHQCSDGPLRSWAALARSSTSWRNAPRPRLTDTRRP